MINALHRKIERHEFNDRSKAPEGRTDAKPGKSVFGDRCVNHAIGTEFLQKSFRDLVGTLILRDLLAHQEDGRVPAASPPPSLRSALAERKLSWWPFPPECRVRAAARMDWQGRGSAPSDLRPATTRPHRGQRAPGSVPPGPLRPPEGWQSVCSQRCPGIPREPKCSRLYRHRPLRTP